MFPLVPPQALVGWLFAWKSANLARLDWMSAALPCASAASSVSAKPCPLGAAFWAALPALRRVVGPASIAPVVASSANQMGGLFGVLMDMTIAARQLPCNTFRNISEETPLNASAYDEPEPPQSPPSQASTYESSPNPKPETTCPPGHP